MIEVNRLSHFLHKMNFLHRQRSALDYGKKFVITDRDLKKASGAKSHDSYGNAQSYSEDRAALVLEGFDPM